MSFQEQLVLLMLYPVKVDDDPTKTDIQLSNQKGEISIKQTISTVAKQDPSPPKESSATLRNLF